MLYKQATTQKHVLALSMQDARVPAPGGETRSYFFLQSLVNKRKLSVVCLSGGQRFSPELSASCFKVIKPTESNFESRNHTETPSLQKKLRLVRAFAFPWLNQWYDFQNYFVQYGLPLSTPQTSSLKHSFFRIWTRQWYRFATRYTNINPFTTLIYERNFRRCLPEILSIHKQTPFNYLWCEHSIIYPYIERLQKQLGPLPVICNSHNVETLLQQRLSDNSTDPWTAEFQRMQTALFRRIESKCYADSKLVFTCSKDDAEHAARLAPNGNFLVVGNGVDTEYFTPKTKTTSGNNFNLLFTGGFGYKPNRDAVTYFVRDILPLIWNEVPACQFTFAGANATDLYDELKPTDARIKYVSNPIDIRPLFDEAAVYVVPIQSGGGTRLKVLEAMSMNKAIVSTTVGSEGIPCTSNEHIVFADSAMDFAKATAQLLLDQKRQIDLGQNASVWVRQTFDWKILQRTIDSAIDQTIT
jgi:glycosyltransferase involved in cell wall biosynthesis